MRKDRKKCLRRSLSERPQRRSTRQKLPCNAGGCVEPDSIDNNRVTRRAGIATQKMGFRKPKHIKRLESMKNVFAKLALSDDMSQVKGIEKSNIFRNTWPSINNSDQCMKRRITRRHSFAVESLIRPACAKLEESTTWSPAKSCVLETDGVTRYQCKPFGLNGAVFLGHAVGDGLYYWGGTDGTRKCCIFGHKALGEWKYLTEDSGKLIYKGSSVSPSTINLENPITDSRVFYYDDRKLVSAVKDDYLIGVGIYMGEPILKLESLLSRSDNSKWSF